MRLLQIDVGKKSASVIAVGKAPEEMAFIDARYMVVANALSDTLQIIDRPAAKVAAEVSLGPTHGIEPTALAYDAMHSRLYATLASANGVALFKVDSTAQPPTLTAVGIIPTAWWPTSVVIHPADVVLFFTN